MALKQQSVEAMIKREYCLNEGRNADKAKEKTLEVIRDFFNNASWIEDEFVDAAANPNHLSVINYIENRLKERCFHANIPDSVIRLEPVIMNIALSLGFEQGNPDTAKLNRLFRIITYITKCVKEKLVLPIQLNQLNLENTTYDRLNDVFGTILDKQDADEEERINNADYSAGINKAYDILSDIDYATANKYGNYSCSDSKLCYTQDKSTWNQYTNRGSNTVYLLLHKDWEKIHPEHGADTPYDAYGLSMIFVFIDEEGNIAYSNTRWNHQTDGKGPSNVDQSFTKEMLSKLLNVNFGEVFKPLHTFAEKVAKAKQQLQNGADPRDVFDYVGGFLEGFAMVKLGNKFNFIDTDNNILREDLWFDDESYFSNGFARVKLKDRGYNFIKPDGNILREDLWFDDEAFFCNGFARVKLKDRGWNFIKADGNILRDDLWFDEVRSFVKGFAKVKLGSKWNFINTNGELISDLWFDFADDFHEGFAAVILKDRGWNYINTNGELISDLWFTYTWDFKDGFASVKLIDRGWNFIKPDGNILRDDLWFNNVYDFSEGFARVNLEGRGWNFINTNGELISDLWFDDAWSFSNGFARVNLKDKGWNFLKPDGSFLRDDLWFDYAYEFREGFASVELDGKRCYLDTKGNLYDEDYNLINKVNENR